VDRFIGKPASLEKLKSEVGEAQRAAPPPCSCGPHHPA
jgi:hypothetical protein